MADSPLVPPLDMTCGKCARVVEICAGCKVAFHERAPVICRAEAGHFHPACLATESVRETHGGLPIAKR